MSSAEMNLRERRSMDWEAALRTPSESIVLVTYWSENLLTRMIALKTNLMLWVGLKVYNKDYLNDFFAAASLMV